MSSPSPPKPWETSGGATSASVGQLRLAFGTSAAAATNICTGLTGSNSSITPSATPTTSSNAPPLPSVPDSLSTVANRNATNYSSMNNRYGSPYGGMNSYSSPYSSMGGGYGSMYGGMGGMGGMYGGMGGMGMGMGGMYGGMGGMPGDPNSSLTQSFSQSTAATFQLIENIDGAFGGFAQMLQSTYMATHSSFFGTVTFFSLLHYLLTCHSHGIRCRAVWKLATNPRLSIGHLYYNAMDQNSHCKTHRTTAASRRNRIDTCKLRSL